MKDTLAICNKSNKGGTRQGSGAKPKYNEKTTTIAFRIPVSLKDKIKELVKDYIQTSVI